MQEIYLDDYHLHSLNTAHLPTKVDRGVEGLEAPEQRLDAYNTPGADGHTIANILHGARPITLEGKIRGYGDTEDEKIPNYRSNRAAFHQLVGANRVNGRLSPRVLKLTDNTGAQYRVNVVVRGLKNPDEYPTLSSFQLQLLATDFRLYGETQQSRTITLPISGGMELPIDFPERFGVSSGGVSTISNAGTVSSPPLVKLYGPMQNPRIANNTTGDYLELTQTLVSGDVITVDMAARTIIQGASTNRMSIKTVGSRFWYLEPGENNLSFSATAFDSGYVTITYRDAYLGL